MGRAPDVKSYVKQGCDFAETEIEIKGKRGKRNPVVWRRFSRDDDKSQYRLDGKNTTKRAIQDLVASFGVQANNLWYVVINLWLLTPPAPSSRKTRSRPLR